MTDSRQVREVDAGTLKGLLDRGEAVLVDVREPHEHEAERIPGAMLLALSAFDPNRLPRQQGKTTILHCGTGNRSGKAGERCLEAGHSEAIHLKGGLKAWKEAGYRVEHGPPPPG